MSDLKTRIKEVIIESLELEDITPADIVDSAPIFGKNAAGEGLGLDSIDALELGIAVKENFGVTFSTVKEETKKHFASVDALAAYISANTKG
jgi:acyl carrier protein